LNFSGRFSKKTKQNKTKQTQTNFMKIRPEEPSCSKRTERLIDRQTGMTNLKVAFCSFAKAPKNGSFVTGGEGVERLLWLRKWADL